MKINELWNNVIAFGYIVRMFGMDGLKMWQPIKERLNSAGDVPDNYIHNCARCQL
jgi:hypothetical protein